MYLSRLVTHYYLKRLGLVGMKPGLTLEPRQRHQAVDIDVVLVHVPWIMQTAGDGQKDGRQL